MISKLVIQIIAVVVCEVVGFLYVFLSYKEVKIII